MECRKSQQYRELLSPTRPASHCLHLTEGMQSPGDIALKVHAVLAFPALDGRGGHVPPFLIGKQLLFLAVTLMRNPGL